MYTEPIPHVVSKEVPPLSEAPAFLKTIAAPAVVDSSVASGTDRGVSESVAEVPAPAAPSADPYEHIRDFFTVAADEPAWYKDLRDNMMEMFRDTFTDNEGEAVAVPDIKQPRIGYGPLGQQQFPEACSACETALGPQGEPIFRFNENHDEKGQFTSGVTAVAEQGGHAGGGVSSEEELARPGKHYIVDKHGRVSYHGKSFAPEETPPGGAHVTVKPNGDFQVNAGTLTESMKSSLAKAVLRA